MGSSAVLHGRVADRPRARLAGRKTLVTFQCHSATSLPWQMATKSRLEQPFHVYYRFLEFFQLCEAQYECGVRHQRRSDCNFSHNFRMPPVAGGLAGLHFDTLLPNLTLMGTLSC